MHDVSELETDGGEVPEPAEMVGEPEMADEETCSELHDDLSNDTLSEHSHVSLC